MSNANIGSMNDKQLRNEVQLLRDELAIMKRKYEDIFYNLDDANFSERFVKEKDNMKTAITVTAEGIKAKVSREEFDSQMIQTASLIATKVSNTDLQKYSTTEQTADMIRLEVNALGDDFVTNTIFEQRANSIKMSVNAMYSNPVEVDGFNQFNADENNVYYDTSENTYWYFNGAEWCESNNANFGTVFEQTATGFALKGNVTIDGSLVTNISKVNDTLYVGSYTDTTEKKLVFNNLANITSYYDEFHKLYSGLDIVATDMKLSTTSTISLYGILNLKSVPEIWWGNNAPVAVFG